MASGKTAVRPGRKSLCRGAYVGAAHGILITQDPLSGGPDNPTICYKNNIFSGIDRVIKEYIDGLEPHRRLNRYVYCANNPVNLIDPLGLIYSASQLSDLADAAVDAVIDYITPTEGTSGWRTAAETLTETIGDIAKMPADLLRLGEGTASGIENIGKGNYGAAAIDFVKDAGRGATLAGGAAAVASKIVKGAGKGAGAAGKALDKTSDAVGDTAKAGGKIDEITQGSGSVEKGMRNTSVREAVEKGKRAHGDFAEKVKAKDGWKSEPRMKTPDGKTVRPDAVTKGGKPVELKPNTPSGRAQGARQLPKYEQATGQKGRVVTYDPNKY